MPLDTIAITDVIDAPQITPGLGGWDGVINSFMANNAGRQRYGLLSRITNFGGTPDPTNLIVLPPGWQCAVSQVMVVPEGSADPGSPTLQFGWDSLSAPDNWLPGSGNSSISLSDLAVSSGLPLNCLMIHPFAGGSNFPTGLTPAYVLPAIPIGDGDTESGANSRYFTMDSLGTFSGLVHVSVFGMVWPKDDS